jgi:putative ABC transport system permease protein
MIKNYLKIAWRSIAKNRIYSVINIGGLALGLASSVLIMFCVQNELNYDAYHAKSKNIYRIDSHLKNESETYHWAFTPLKFGEFLKENCPEINNFTRIFIPYGRFSLKINNEIISEDKLAFVDKNWFDIFDYKLVNGSLKNFQTDKNNIAITESKAKKYFGNDNPIGKIIKHDSINFVVQAVLKDNPSNTNFQFDLLAHNQARLANQEVLKYDSEWNNFSYQTFVVCNDGSNIQNISNKLSALLIALRNEEDSKTYLDLEALNTMHLNYLIRAEGMPVPVDQSVLAIFSIVALFILVIACINYINLTTAKASQRNKEVAVKKIVGASKVNLFYQFFIESILTSFIAAFFAIVLIVFGLPILENIADIKFSIIENPIILLILILATLLCVLLTGIYPSVILSTFQPAKLLKGISVGGVKNATLRKCLVVFQFTFTIVLLIFTFFIYEQLDFVQNKKLGYDKENIFTFSIPYSINNREATNQTIVQKLTSESCIQGVTVSNMNIVDVNSTHSGSLNWKGKDPNWEPVVTPLLVTSNYKYFFNLKMAEGRWFIKSNVADNNNVVLNETAIKEFKIPLPVTGQLFELHGRKGIIIGVVKDFHFRSPKEKINPLVMYTNSGWYSTFFVKSNPENIKKSIAATEKIWKEFIPELAFNYQFLNDAYNKLHIQEKKQLQILNSFVCIVLLISCFGLFGLATFATEVRTKEIGIRKVLGASVVHIVKLLSQDFLRLILIAILIAAPIAWLAANSWLQNYAYHITIQVWIFILVGLLILIIALFTVSYQAIKVAISNPVKSLRIE